MSCPLMVVVWKLKQCGLSFTMVGNSTPSDFRALIHEIYTQKKTCEMKHFISHFFLKTKKNNNTSMKEKLGIC